ncbi:MAG: NAD-dependent protein deacylase, partial [Bifidobacteriaceae bacterium]|nr:NAD-dependent protein deacylase [Bifidobacteriaceae bacterium]
GVSTESGIPDFRSTSGLYNQEWAYPPETILSHTFWLQNPSEFYRFYRAKMIIPNAKPNAAHKKLANLEKAGIIKAVITQNIDNLHYLAGSKNVLELHGSVYRNNCAKCRAFYSVNAILEANDIPYCKKEGCSGIIKPDVVLYEEPLNNGVWAAAEEYIKSADTLIIAGTSLTVYPAASLIYFFSGKNLVLINKSVTNADSNANLLFNDSVAKVFEKINI